MVSVKYIFNTNDPVETRHMEWNFMPTLTDPFSGMREGNCPLRKPPTCVSDLPTDMKRGFLNSKKAKGKTMAHPRPALRLLRKSPSLHLLAILLLFPVQ